MKFPIPTILLSALLFSCSGGVSVQEESRHDASEAKISAVGGRERCIVKFSGVPSDVCRISLDLGANLNPIPYKGK